MFGYVKGQCLCDTTESSYLLEMDIYSIAAWYGQKIPSGRFMTESPSVNTSVGLPKKERITLVSSFWICLQKMDATNRFLFSTSHLQILLVILLLYKQDTYIVSLLRL